MPAFCSKEDVIPIFQCCSLYKHFSKVIWNQGSQCLSEKMCRNKKTHGKSSPNISLSTHLAVASRKLFVIHSFVCPVSYWAVNSSLPSDHLQHASLHSHTPSQTDSLFFLYPILFPEQPISIIVCRVHCNH